MFICSASVFPRAKIKRSFSFIVTSEKPSSRRLRGETLSSLVDKSLFVRKSCEVLNLQKRFVFAYFLLYLKEILSSTRKICLLLEDKGPQARKVFEESYCVKQ